MVLRQSAVDHSNQVTTAEWFQMNVIDASACFAVGSLHRPADAGQGSGKFFGD
ncbi:hypothetical protein SynMITS9220_01816 [Synechococcus sp. MIT S9220]|nr:hypothetical protein SynMITS9220_01816 [Synechococcus sp. MIT S9220]